MDLPEFVIKVFNKFNHAGYQLYLVGGSVRDLLTKTQVKDWDFTTDAKPDEMLELFPKGFYNNKFGTVGIPIIDVNEGLTDKEEGGQVLEITTMRKEGDYKDFRHPAEVSWTNQIEEDLSRRDFSINAIALKITGFQKPTTNFELIDPFFGQKDIKDKLIKAVGDPNLRFQEDALRLLRAIRFSAQLGFEIEDKTYQSIKNNSQLISEVAGERVRDELFKILSSDDAYGGINKLKDANLLGFILPELNNCFGIKQEGPKHDRVYDIGEHSLLALKFCPNKDPLVRLAVLLHDIGKPDTFQKDEETGNVTFYNHDIVGANLSNQISRRFNLSKKQSEKLYKLIRYHMFSLNEHQTDSAIRRFIKNIGIENIDDMMDLRIGDRLGGGTTKPISWRMKNFRDRINQVLTKPFSITDLKINGEDVMRVLDINPGPKVGKILKLLFEEIQQDPSKNSREYLHNRLEEIKVKLK